MVCHINNYNTPCILDTGTEITIIKSSILEKLNLTHNIKPAQNMSVQTACGRAASFRRAHVNLSFNNENYELNAIIVPELKVECL